MTKFLTVGLGNPGAEYAKQRHNAGFWFADALAVATAATFHAEKKFSGAVATTAAASILKPDTYMNNSGRAVAAFVRYHKLPPESVLVVHDEADLPCGVARLKFGGGAGGHNGIADISSALQNPAFWRLRIGVGRPATTDIADYVLSAPSAAERASIDEAIGRTLKIWPHIADGNWEKAMLLLHSSPPETAAEPAQNQAQNHATA